MPRCLGSVVLRRCARYTRETDAGLSHGSLRNINSGRQCFYLYTVGLPGRALIGSRLRSGSAHVPKPPNDSKETRRGRRREPSPVGYDDTDNGQSRGDDDAQGQASGDLRVVLPGLPRWEPATLCDPQVDRAVSLIMGFTRQAPDLHGPANEQLYAFLK